MLNHYEETRTLKRAKEVCVLFLLPLYISFFAECENESSIYYSLLFFSFNIMYKTDKITKRQQLFRYPIYNVVMIEIKMKEYKRNRIQERKRQSTSTTTIATTMKWMAALRTQPEYERKNKKMRC